MYKKTASCFGLIVAITLMATATFADTEQDLRNAVSSMNSWLGSSAKARRWRQILDLNILDTQSALGHRANPNALYCIKMKFDQDIPGLTHPAFRRVRDCIDRHLIQLSNNYTDISYSGAVASSQFKNMDADTLERMRQDAIYQVQMMVRHYRNRLRSRERGLLFYEIRPNDAIEFLTNFNIELPSDRTEQIIAKEIAAVKDEILRIDQQIEALNEQRKKINEWKESLENQNRSQDLEPPSPDDDETTTAIDQQEESVTQTNRQQELESIENGASFLTGQKEELQLRLVELEEERDSVKVQERERIQRYLKARGDYDTMLDRFKYVSPERIDSYFDQTIDSLIDFRQAYRWAADPRTSTSFDDWIEEFNQKYALFAVSPDRRTAAELARLTGLMEAAGQANDLVGAVRKKHSLPNLFFELSSDLVNQFALQEISEYRRVNEQVLSRLIRGIAYVEGIGSLQFIPDWNQARMAIDLSGFIDSDTFTKSGCLTAYAGAVAEYNVRREMFVNVGGMFADELYGFLDLESYFKGIDSRLGIVQRLARKQFQKTKQLAESISASRTREQVFEQFQEQTDETVTSAYERFENINQRQTDFGRLLPELFLFTTSDRMVAVGHHSTPFDFAATNQPQCFDHVPADIRLKLNETLLSNYISPILADRQLTNSELAEEISRLLQREIRRSEDAQEFSVKFDPARPIQFEFENNTLGVTITGIFQRKGTRGKNNLRIKLAYKLENDGMKLSLVPAKAADVDLVDPTKRNIGTQSMISVLERILTEVTSNAEDSDIEIPLNLIFSENMGPDIKPIAEQMALTQYRIEDGWLYAAWKYQPENHFYGGIVDTPAIQYPTAVPDDLAPSAIEDTDLDVSDQLEDLEEASDLN